MSQQLTSTQAEILQLLPATLGQKEMGQLESLLKAFFAKTEKGQTDLNMATEPSVAYTVSAESEPIHLTIPRNWLDDPWLSKLLNWVEMKHLTERNQMTKTQALEMGKQAKANWWAENQHWVLAKVKEQP